MSIERRRNPPHAAFALAQLSLLLRRVLVQSVRRVRDNRVNSVVSLPPDPVEAISMVQDRPANANRLPPLLHRWGILRYASRHTSCRWLIHGPPA